MKNKYFKHSKISEAKFRQILRYFALDLSLAVDNVFVWLMIFSYFAIPRAYQRRVLLYGVLGAIVLRTLMVFAGSWLITEFHWVLYVFGAFLLFTGIRMLMLMSHGEGDLASNPVLKWCRKHIKMTDELDGEKFFTFKNGVRFATPLLVALILVEISDVVFAVDSIPAIFAITKDPFIVLTSNLLAILGLRAMYFMLADIADRFALIKYGLAGVLVFIGVKLLILEYIKIPIGISLLVIVGLIGGSIAASLWVSREETKRLK
ncbi:Inner membrane protein alx [Ephemeroptericola cinctiostellae]|uniref:Inner membrane protein alx n=1 Tax=Ephemeroptericola cinctiostellae TaxID=2268024 RepID=A0A345D7W9_9BURK|nr:Inner membrane protein alx [Ephemeroptericola cinctiostellae]